MVFPIYHISMLEIDVKKVPTLAETQRAHLFREIGITAVCITPILSIYRNKEQNREDQPRTDISYHVPPSHVYTDHRFSG